MVTAPLVTSAPANVGGQGSTHAEESQRAIRIEDAIEFRRGHGFPADPQDVRDMDANRDAYPEAVAKYGLPLSAGEMDQLGQRDRLAEAAGALEGKAGRIAGATFAGAFIAGSGAGTLEVGFTRAADEMRTVLRSHFPYPRQLETFTAALSLRELELYEAELTTDLLALHAELGVVSVAVDPSSNNLSVGVEERSGEIAAELERRYPGAPLQVTEARMPRLTSYESEYVPPLLAGLLIYRYTGAQTAACSAAFAAKKTAGTNFFQLTAGHCGRNGDVWFHYHALRYEYRVGEGEANGFYGGADSPVDAQRLDIPDFPRSSTVYEPTGTQPIHRVDNQPTDGETECVSAWGGAYHLGDGKRCGQVLQPASVAVARNPYNGNLIILTTVAKVAIRTCRGDSGGPMYHNDSAEGIVSATDIRDGASCGRPTFTQNLGPAQNRLDVRILAPS